MAARSFILSMSSTGCWGQSREQEVRTEDGARKAAGKGKTSSKPWHCFTRGKRGGRKAGRGAEGRPGLAGGPAAGTSGAFRNDLLTPDVRFRP